MRRRCAWCDNDLEGPGVGAMADGKVTHGICPDCLNRVQARSGIPLDEYLMSLHEPVFLLDQDHVVGAVSEEALDLVGQPAGGVVGKTGGVVFSCENAGLPEGCGRTIHCSGCTIQQSVAHTFSTGEPRLNVPATLKASVEGEALDVALVISTRKLGDRVLLKIDEYRR